MREEPPSSPGNSEGVFDHPDAGARCPGKERQLRIGKHAVHLQPIPLGFEQRHADNGSGFEDRAD